MILGGWLIYSLSVKRGALADSILEQKIISATSNNFGGYINSFKLGTNKDKKFCLSKEGYLSFVQIIEHDFYFLTNFSAC